MWKKLVTTAIDCGSGGIVACEEEKLEGEEVQP